MTEPIQREATAGEDVGWALGALLRAYREMVAPALGDCPHGARGYHTLAEVTRGQRPSQLALANHLGIDRTVMTYLVDDLEAAGLVKRRLNLADRRQRQIVATDRGHRLVATLCQRVVEAENAVLGTLGPDERDTLRRLLVKAASETDADLIDPCKVDAD